MIDEVDLQFDYEEHPHRDEGLHPVLLIFKMLETLEFGCLPLSDLENGTTTLSDIFSY